MSPTLIPTILCGGAGSRLWPVSRELHPKPFIRLADGQSLLQKAYLRGARLAEVSDVLTVTNRELFFKTEGEFREVGAALGKRIAHAFILEPVGRNTAPAIVAAALATAATHGDDAQLLVLAADHLVADEAAFATAVTQASALAAAGKLVTFGIRPDRPETGYGYIEADGTRVVSFVEKPGVEKAREYLATSRYLWNSGIFCFSVGALLGEMEQHSPAVLEAVRRCLGQSSKTEGRALSHLDLDAAAFAQVPDQSIDYALMEKSRNVAVVPCSIGWNDVGSWNELGDLTRADASGNRVEGEALLHEVNDCYIRSSGRVVGAVGVSGLVVIDTPDALLVADRTRTQEVKHIYADLKARNHAAHKCHRTVHRPWGSFTVLEEGPRFKIKRIEVRPGASLSLQMHYHRSEHWVVVSGTARIVNEASETLLRSNESTYIAAGHKHRLENPGLVPVVLIEVQSGEYLGEDDIVRFNDQYGRAES